MKLWNIVSHYSLSGITFATHLYAWDNMLQCEGPKWSRTGWWMEFEWTTRNSLEGEQENRKRMRLRRLKNSHRNDSLRIPESDMMYTMVLLQASFFSLLSLIPPHCVERRVFIVIRWLSDCTTKMQKQSFIWTLRGLVLSQGCLKNGNLTDMLSDNRQRKLTILFCSQDLTLIPRIYSNDIRHLKSKSRSSEFG